MFTFTKDTICDAISRRRLLQFNYNNHARVVEPHLLGRDRSEHDVLSAYLVRGFSESGQKPYWRKYRLTEMRLVVILDEDFPGPRKDYNPNDKRMSKIYCRLPRD